MTSDGNGTKQIDPRKITVHTNTVAGSTYAQITGVVITDIDITIEFVYISPREGTTDAHVVSRVTMPRPVGEALAKSIMETVVKHEAKKKGGKGVPN